MSLNRHGDREERDRKEQDEARLGLDVDYDRIVFSAAFRSLQDKTQVVPLPSQVSSQKGFVHTRLTHSLEVASVGRSLGRMAGQTLIRRNPELDRNGYRFTDFGSIVSAASLAHDIGNPPFGHGGEKAIGSYFAEGAGRGLIENLTPKEQADLIEFEGNANGFHLLTSDRPGVPGGIRLSFSTLGAFIKYPRESLPGREKTHITDKKYGIFQHNLPFFAELAQNLGLQDRGLDAGTAYYRHPLTYLVEAADDICYTVIDAEDGVAMSLLEAGEMEELFSALLGEALNRKKLNGLKGKTERMAYLRSVSINFLTNQCVEVFLEHEKQLLTGTLNASLVDLSPSVEVLRAIIERCVEKMYRSAEVIEKELQGFRVLTRLLQQLCPLYLRYGRGETSYQDRLVLSMIRDPYLRQPMDTYRALLHAASYVASLSDSAAVSLNDQIAGTFPFPD